MNWSIFCAVVDSSHEWLQESCSISNIMVEVILSQDENVTKRLNHSLSKKLSRACLHSNLFMASSFKPYLNNSSMLLSSIHIDKEILVCISLSYGLRPVWFSLWYHAGFKCTLTLIEVRTVNWESLMKYASCLILQRVSTNWCSSQKCVWT